MKIYVQFSFAERSAEVHKPFKMDPHVNINDERGILIFTPGTSHDSGLKPEKGLMTLIAV